MPPSIEKQLEVPHVEIVNGNPVTFPRLSLDDLIPWSLELKRVRVKEVEDRANANPKLSELQRFELVQGASDQGIQLGWLLGKAHEPAGIRKVLVMSLTKAKMPGQEILDTLSCIHYQRQRLIALEVLSPPPVPEEAKGESDEGFTSPETGHSTETSPINSADVT